MEFRVETLLLKYRKMFSDRESERRRIGEIVHAQTGIAIDEKDIVVKKGVLHLCVKSSLVRNELFFRKDKVLASLREAGFALGELKI